MSIVKDNIVTEGLSGMLGGVVVFRQLRGKTIMANRPWLHRDHRFEKGFALASVQVTMADAQGSPLITQAATLKDRESNEWIARLPLELTSNSKAYEGCQVIVVATDHTGNMARSVTAYNRAAA